MGIAGITIPKRGETHGKAPAVQRGPRLAVCSDERSGWRDSLLRKVLANARRAPMFEKCFASSNETKFNWSRFAF